MGGDYQAKVSVSAKALRSDLAPRLEDQEGGYCGRNSVSGDRHPGQVSNGPDHAWPLSNVRNSTFALNEVGSL